MSLWPEVTAKAIQTGTAPVAYEHGLSPRREPSPRETARPSTAARATDMNTDPGYCRTRDPNTAFHSLLIQTSPWSRVTSPWSRVASGPPSPVSSYHCHHGHRWEADLQGLPDPLHLPFFLFVSFHEVVTGPLL